MLLGCALSVAQVCVCSCGVCMCAARCGCACCVLGQACFASLLHGEGWCRSPLPPGLGAGSRPPHPPTAQDHVRGAAAGALLPGGVDVLRRGHARRRHAHRPDGVRRAMGPHRSGPPGPCAVTAAQRPRGGWFPWECCFGGRIRPAPCNSSPLSFGAKSQTHERQRHQVDAPFSFSFTSDPKITA